MINSINIKRKLPVNIKITDIELFDKELFYKYNIKPLYQIKNITIIDDFTFVKRFRILKDETKLNYCNLYKDTFFTIIKNIGKLILRKSIYISIDVVWVIDSWSIGYFHWMTDVLQRILEMKKNNITEPIILPNYYKKLTYVTKTLDILNINVIYYDTSFIKKIKNIYFIPHQSTTGNYNEKYIKELREIFRDNTFYKKKSKKRKIYISREKALKRKVQNEKEVIEILKKNNFKIYYFEDLSFVEQIEIMINATTLLSIHGAGLTNMMFMQKNTNIIELRLSNDKFNNCYFSLASALELNYYYLKCEGTSDNTWNADFIVDIKALKKLLKEI